MSPPRGEYEILPARGAPGPPLSRGLNGPAAPGAQRGCVGASGAEPPSASGPIPRGCGSALSLWGDGRAQNPRAARDCGTGGTRPGRAAGGWERCVPSRVSPVLLLVTKGNPHKTARNFPTRTYPGPIDACVVMRHKCIWAFYPLRLNAPCSCGVRCVLQCKPWVLLFPKMLVHASV